VADYLGYFGDLGYLPTLLDKENGTEKAYPSVRALLDEWVADELRDVLLLPAH
jgi:hypothetical protein